MQFFAPPSTPFLWLSLGFGLLALLTHGGWTTEFRAHRATFTAHAPARRAASVAKLHLVLQDLAARDFNAEFSPATFSGQPRSSAGGFGLTGRMTGALSQGIEVQLGA